MALRSFSIAGAAGFTCSLFRNTYYNPENDLKNKNHSNLVLCKELETNKPTLPEVGKKPSGGILKVLNDAAEFDEAFENANRHPSEACKCVVIGGGLSGGKAAYYMDALFDVTLIDEKNFFELSYGAIPLVTQPWNENPNDTNNDDSLKPNSVNLFKKISVLHRYYLKRANVLTGTATTVTENEVILSDGRRVPYDILILATGAQKPFPFRTTQRTLAGRIDELKNFNYFLKEKCKKVAIIGGGPAGCALAASLLEQQPDKDIVLFHSHDELLPRMPKNVRTDAHRALTSMKENTQKRKRLFGKSQFVSDATPEDGERGSFKLLLNHRVNALEAMPNSLTTIVSKPASSSSSSNSDVATAASPTQQSSEETTSSLKSFFSNLFQSKKSSSSASRAATATETFQNVPLKYRIYADELDTGVGSNAELQNVVNSRSLFHRWWFGDVVPSNSKYIGLFKSAVTEADPSSASSATINDIETLKNVKIKSIKKENLLFEDFDYVFDMRGTVPRPLINLSPSEIDSLQKNPSAAQNSGKDSHILNAHILPNGKYRVSLLMQLLNRPNTFALGRCNSLPWENSPSMSNMQTKTLFNIMMGILMADPEKPKSLMAATDGLQPHMFFYPRVFVPFGNFEAAGFSTQKGMVTGAQATMEYRAEKDNLMLEFQKPVFFKRRDQRESKKRILCWLNDEITDVTDFCF